MEKQKISIGLLGFGNNGQGLYEALEKSKELKAGIRKICIKHPEKVRHIDMNLISGLQNNLANHQHIVPNIQAKVIDQDTLDRVKFALVNKKRIVSANQNLVPEHILELNQLSLENDMSLIFNGSDNGNMQIIKSLENDYDIELNFCFVLNTNT